MDEIENDTFVAYVGDRDIHDAVVKSVHHADARVEVTVEAVDGRRIRILFTDVKSFRARNAEGMILYALTEMLGVPPHRKFVFTNTDEDHEAELIVEAQDLKLADEHHSP